MNRSLTLSKHERLKSKKDIDTLFLTGKAFFIPPFKVFYELKPAGQERPGLRFGISVPKRSFKRAVDRNLLKRRVRELYRLHKNVLQEGIINRSLQLNMMWVYTDKDILSSESMRPAVIKALARLQRQCTESV